MQSNIKLYFRGTSRPKVFPIGESNQDTVKPSEHGIMMCDGRDNRSCLRAGRTPEVGYAGVSIRRLTPTECCRLQGFPDSWCNIGLDKDGKETIISDSQKYKCLGNAVTTNVVDEIGKRLIV